MLGFDTVFIYVKGRRDLDRMVIGFATLVQSEPITTKVVYSINKIDRQDISVACLPKSRDWWGKKLFSKY